MDFLGHQTQTKIDWRKNKTKTLLINVKKRKSSKITCVTVKQIRFYNEQWHRTTLGSFASNKNGASILYVSWIYVWDKKSLKEESINSLWRMSKDGNDCKWMYLHDLFVLSALMFPSLTLFNSVDILSRCLFEPMSNKAEIW